MNIKVSKPTNGKEPSQYLSEKSLRAMAEALYRELKESGCAPKDIVSFSTHLIQQVTDGLKVNEESVGAH